MAQPPQPPTLEIPVPVIEEPIPDPSPVSPTATHLDSRRPSASGSALAPNSPYTLRPSSSSYLDPHSADNSGESSRSRSSSVAGASFLSGDTAVPSNTDVVRSAEANFPDDLDALEPRPGRQGRFTVPNNKFAFTPGEAACFYNPKDLNAFRAVGGLRGLEKGLRTDTQAGLSLDETHLDGSVTKEEARSYARSKAAAADGTALRPVESGKGEHFEARQGDMQLYADRKAVFGDNRVPAKKGKNLLQIMWMQYNDKILWLLTAAAVVSLALGIYETVGVEHPDICDDNGENCEPPPPAVDWVEGLAICVAIIIVVMVGALNDWQKERQFARLNAKKEARMIKVVRNGRSQEISVYDLLVGDVLHMEPGDMLPADGVMIEGTNIKCDESSATGESDIMKKMPGDEVYRQLIDPNTEACRLLDLENEVRKIRKENARRREEREKLKKSIPEELKEEFDKEVPLVKECRLDPFLISGSKVNEGTGTMLVTATGVTSFYGNLMSNMNMESAPTPLQEKLEKLAGHIAWLGGGSALILFIVLLIRFLAGLPGDIRPATEKASSFLDILIVAITLVVVAIPEGLPLAVTLALAFATTRMLKDNNLVRVLRSCETMGNATTVCSDKTGTLTQNKMTVVRGVIATAAKFNEEPELGAGEPTGTQILSGCSQAVQYLLKQSIALNSTAFEGEVDGVQTFIGSKTEAALLTFARDRLDMRHVDNERSIAKTIQAIPFDSARKCMGIVIRLADDRYRLYVKGASEIVLAQCTRRITDLDAPELTETDLTVEDRTAIEQIINEYAESSLRTIAMVYKDYAQWPPVGAQMAIDEKGESTGDVVFEDIYKDMVFVSVVGIKDPLRPGVPEAVEQCRKAGVKVRMVTGDNIITARAIARECGIYTGGLVMEGPQFRELMDQSKELYDTVRELDVLARSSPTDKQKLVKALRELGDIVAVTGDGTNDGPALKAADVGFSMGIAGTEVAKEASSIILMDDNFASIIKALMWGRAVNDAVQKFLQFQLTVNVTAVLLTFVSAVASKEMESVLTAVQLLWVNLIMDTFAALALATDPPTPAILDRKPTPRGAYLVSVNMWKMILGQAIFQLLITFLFHFGGPTFFPEDWTDAHVNTIVFNTFVWMQIFNMFNNRRLDNKLNIFEGIHRNFFFMAIALIMIGGQILIVFVGGAAFSIKHHLTGEMWALCICVSLLCIPWAILVRMVPDIVVVKAWEYGLGPVVKVVARATAAVGRFFAPIVRPVVRMFSRVFSFIGRVLEFVFWPFVKAWDMITLICSRVFTKPDTNDPETMGYSEKGKKPVKD